MIEVLGIGQGNRCRPIKRRVAGWHLGFVGDWGTGVAETRVEGEFAVGNDERLYVGKLVPARKAFVATSEWRVDFSKRSRGLFSRPFVDPLDPVLGRNWQPSGRWEHNLARLQSLLDSAR
jgi:hypothetical protein